MNAITTDQLLTGTRVLDLSRDVSGALCARWLADYGADVIKVEPPGGDPIRRRGPFAGDRPGPDRSGPFWLLNQNKRGIVLDLETRAGRRVLRDLAARADIVIESFPAGYLADRGLGFDDLRRANPNLILTSLTPYGQTGPDRDRPATGLTFSAQTGWIYGTGDPDREPVRSGERFADYLSVHPALIATLGAYLDRTQSGGRWIDIAHLEAIEALMMFATVASDYIGGRLAKRTGRRLPDAAPYTILEASDGYFAIITYTDAQWESLARLMGLEHLIGAPGYESRLQRAENADQLEALMAPWVRARTKVEAFLETQRARVPCAYIADAADLLGMDQLHQRGFWRTLEHPIAGPVTIPGPLGRLSEAGWLARRPAPRLGEHTVEILRDELGMDPARIVQLAGVAAAGTAPPQPPPSLGGEPVRAANAPGSATTAAGVSSREPGITSVSNSTPGLATPATTPPSELGGAGEGPLPLAGVRVIDLTMFWAGPTIGRYLGELGAEVIKVEAPRKMDPWREWINAPGEPGYETSAGHNSTNINKLGITIDLTDPAGRELLLRLVRVSDAILNNFSPRVMPRLGLDYATLAAVKPDLIYLSAPGFGSDGPWRDFVAYAATVESLSGLGATTGYPGAPPVVQGMAPGDPIGGLNAASVLLMALAYRQRTGRGLAIDTSQVEALAAVLVEPILDFQLNGRILGPTANQDPVFAPHGVYPAAGEDRWVAIAVTSDDQFAALLRTIGAPDLAADPRFADAAARWRNQAELTPIISAWSRTRDQRAAAQELIAAGVPAAPVNDNFGVVQDPQLVARDFFQSIDRAVVGRHRYPRTGMRISGADVGNRRPAPLFGEQNDVIFRQLLGLADGELEDLRRRSVIGDAPLAGGE